MSFVIYQIRRTRLPEDVADASKYVGVLTICKILFIYIYIYIYIYTHTRIYVVQFWV
jgi:hypothetical protein